MEYENKEICRECGGSCCKKSGCDYYTSDFEVLNKNAILDLLKTGNVSIVSALKFSKTKDGKTIVSPFLYLRARNEDRDVIDLFSMKRQCSMLTSTGCSYDIENRPAGGVNLIPSKERCTPLLNPMDELNKWTPYQNMLSKIVTRYTGKSVMEVLREDVSTVFCQVLTKDFDGVDEREVAEITSCIQELSLCYPKEYEQAKEKQKVSTKIYCKK